MYFVRSENGHELTRLLALGLYAVDRVAGFVAARMLLRHGRASKPRPSPRFARFRPESGAGSRGFERDHEPAAESAGGFLELIELGAVVGIEDAPDLGFRPADPLAERDLGETGPLPGGIDRSLGGKARRQLDAKFLLGTRAGGGASAMPSLMRPRTAATSASRISASASPLVAPDAIASGSAVA